MTKERVIKVIVDEALATVDRIAEMDRRPLPDWIRKRMVREIQKIAHRNAPTLTECTEAQVREACSRHIRRAVAALRPS